MTKIFDDNARKKTISEINENYLNTNVKVKDIEVKRITPKEARGLISAFHYSKTMPDSTKFVYAGFYENKIIGIVCYGMGCGKNQYTSVMKDIKNGEYLELTRVWCLHNAPINTESKIISKSIKMLPKEIKLILSFADESKGHCGIIYQATNWLYIGKNNGGKMMETEDGIVKHPRLIGIYKKRHPNLKEYSNDEIMKMYGWEYIKGGAKHKYVYIRGDKSFKNKAMENICDKILEYPKCDKPKLKSDIQIIKEYGVSFEVVKLGKQEVNQLKWII